MIGEQPIVSPPFAIKPLILCKAGAGGGLVASVATCPLDVIKTKLQAQRFIQGQQGYEGIIGAALMLFFVVPTRH